MNPIGFKVTDNKLEVIGQEPVIDQDLDDDLALELAMRQKGREKVLLRVLEYLEQVSNKDTLSDSYDHNLAVDIKRLRKRYFIPV